MDTAASNVLNAACTEYWALAKVHRLAVGIVASFVGKLVRCVRLGRRAWPGFLLGARHSQFPPVLRSGRFRGRAGILTGLPWLIGCAMGFVPSVGQYYVIWEFTCGSCVNT